MSGKIKRLTSESQHLLKLADLKAVESENKASLQVMAESNAFHQSAKTKQAEAKAAEAELQYLRQTSN